MSWKKVILLKIWVIVGITAMLLMQPGCKPGGDTCQNGSGNCQGGYQENITNIILLNQLSSLLPRRIVLKDEVSNPVGIPGFSKVALTWSDPVFNNFDHVLITRFPQGSSQSVKVPAGMEVHTVGNLRNGRDYTFTLQVVDIYGNKSVGVDVTVAPSSAALDTTPPATISSPLATPHDGQLLLQWNDPQDDDLNHIEISWSHNGGGMMIIQPGVQSYTVAGLTNDTSYDFTIKAVDISGNVSGAVVVSGTPDATLNDTFPPAEVTALTAISADGQVVLYWNDPVDDDFDHLLISWSPDGGSVVTIQPGVRVYTVSGLTNLTEYTFTVKSVDLSGNVSPGVTTTSTPDPLFTDVYAPGEVTSLVTVGADGQIYIAWNDPLDGDFDHIEITWAQSATPTVTSTQIVAKGSEHFTILPLTNDTSYDLTIITVDSTGNKSIGLAAVEIPNGAQNDTNPPGEVTNLTAIPGNGGILLTWSDPVDGDYRHTEITWTPDAGGPITVLAGSEAYTVTGLTNSTPYTFTIKTVDYSNNTSTGKSITATPDALVTDIFPPAEVTGFTVTPDLGDAVLNWSDPGDGDFDHVEISWSPGGATPQVIAAGTETYTVPGLAAGLLYTYTVRTVDTNGNKSVGSVISISQINRAAGDQSNYSADGVTFNMRYIEGKTTFIGADDVTTATITGDYHVAETEVTYELYTQVRNWALQNGYMLNPGENTYYLCLAQEGFVPEPTGCPGTLEHYPVSSVNWRSVMAWTNALTEWYNFYNGTNFEPVYYTDAAYTIPIRVVDMSAINLTPGSQDNPYIKSDANGFRLPSSNEWELAARYIGDLNGDGDITDAGEYYPHNFSSGADAANGVALPDIITDYDGDGDAEYQSDVAVGAQYHFVGSKSPNAMGIYDMSGNIREWSFDWSTLHAPNTARFRHTSGGVSDREGKIPYTINNYASFRFARSE